jgi:hypothetical protein
LHTRNQVSKKESKQEHLAGRRDSQQRVPFRMPFNVLMGVILLILASFSFVWNGNCHPQIKVTIFKVNHFCINSKIVIFQLKILE